MKTRRPLRRIWESWKAFARKVAMVQTAIVMSVAYFLVIGAASFVSRLLRRDFLNCRRRQQSLWIEREEDSLNLEAYFRQS